MIPGPAPTSDPATPTPEGPAGLLLCRDLFFTSKVVGTAQMLGHRVVVVGGADLALAHLRAWSPRVVFVDLAAGDLVTSPRLLQYIEAAPPGTPFVAFGSHVDTARLAEARAAGCDPVLPRSRFTAELPALIRRAFEGG